MDTNYAFGADIDISNDPIDLKITDLGTNI